MDSHNCVVHEEFALSVNVLDLRQENTKMKKRSMQFVIMAWLLALPVLVLPGNSSAGDLSFLSFENEEMISFDLSLKQYMASFKGMYMEKERGLESIGAAINKLDAMVANAENQSAGPGVVGRLGAIKGMLIQAQGLAVQDRFDEANECAVPIRTELYELHRALDMLTTEDHMIFFHNGVIHRTDPLIAEGRYLELEMMIPFIEGALAKFKDAPKGVTNVKQYNKRYGMLAKQIKSYTATIRELNDYVDPEYGGFLLESMIDDAQGIMNKKYGALYLSFPDGMVWPKGAAPKVKK